MERLYEFLSYFLLTCLWSCLWWNCLRHLYLFVHGEAWRTMSHMKNSVFGLESGAAADLSVIFSVLAGFKLCKSCGCTRLCSPEWSIAIGHLTTQIRNTGHLVLFYQKGGLCSVWITVRDEAQLIYMIRQSIDKIFILLLGGWRSSWPRDEDYMYNMKGLGFW